tara:strand:+ start:631 stop:843 length:213 start_codon:yes stop_codon:yes gene_type:complete
MSLEIEYIEETQEYNISGLKYSIEEAKKIAFFIETKELDKAFKAEEYTQADWDREQVKADKISEHTQDNI